jgi:hypothetical protein
MRLLESALWGTYGYLRGDPPLIVFGILGVTESTAILVRKAMTRHRPVVGKPMAHPHVAVGSQLLDDAVVG